MNCRQAGEWLSPYLDRELDERRRGALEAHLAGCPHCTAELAGLRRAVLVLAAPKATAEPEGLLAEFKQRLAAEPNAVRRPWWTTPWAWSMAGLAAAAAAAGVVFVVQQPRPAGSSATTARVIAQNPVSRIESGSPGAFRAPVAPPLEAEKQETVGKASSPAVVPSAPRPTHSAPMRPGGPPTAVFPFSAPEPETGLGDRAALSRRMRVTPLQQGPIVEVPSPDGRSRVGTVPFASPEARAGAPGMLAPGSLGAGRAGGPSVQAGRRMVKRPGVDERAPQLAQIAAADKTATIPLPGEGASRETLVPGAVRKAASPPAPARNERLDGPARLMVVVHRPSPEIQLREATGEAAPGLGGAAHPPPTSAPVGAPAGPAAAATAVTPEVAAAMRALVELKVSNVPLEALVDRLAVEADVPIVVQHPQSRELRVSAELKGVPLYRALETVASQANLVIEPRSGVITLEPAGALRLQNGGRAAGPSQSAVWAPAWGTLPGSGFGALSGTARIANVLQDRTAQAEKQLARQQPGYGGFSGEARSGRGLSAPTGAGPPRPTGALGADAVQPKDIRFRNAGPPVGLQATSQPTVCPHCRRPLSTRQRYLCPKCRRAVKATDEKCPHCGQAHPARCPACHQPLAAPVSGSRLNARPE